jgi:hypothetical protein
MSFVERTKAGVMNLAAFTPELELHHSCDSANMTDYCKKRIRGIT